MSLSCQCVIFKSSWANVCEWVGNRWGDVHVCPWVSCGSLQ